MKFTWENLLALTALTATTVHLMKGGNFMDSYGYGTYQSGWADGYREGKALAGPYQDEFKRRTRICDKEHSSHLVTVSPLVIPVIWAVFFMLLLLGVFGVI